MTQKFVLPPLMVLAVRIIRGEPAALEEQKRLASEEPETYRQLAWLLIGHTYGKMAERER